MQKEPSLINNDYYNTLGNRWYTAFNDPVALLRLESKAKVPWILAQMKLMGYDLLNPQKETMGLKILDVGCGAGFLSNELAQIGNAAQIQVTGIDLSLDSLTVAKKFDSTSTVNYVEANAMRLPFENGQFDIVTAMDFLEHVEDPQAVIAEISRVLKPGGLFFFHTFNRNPIAHFVIIKLVEALVQNTPKNLHVIELFIKPEELDKFCQNQGLRTLAWTGIRPKLSTISLKALVNRQVPENFQFILTKSKLLSYMGYAKKI